MTHDDRASGAAVEGEDPKTLRLMASAKVMMVDDEPINMQVLQLHLAAEGYDRFIIVSDSTKAMGILRAERPSVLLLDLKMPEVSGFDILQMVRADNDLKQLPIIVLTASNDPETKVRALRLGATDFLSKPVDASELALRMKNTIVARAYEQRLMHFDALTDLPNRLYFSRFVQKLTKESLQKRDQLALVLVNINRFKSINATFGADRGDDLLWAFSQRLQTVFESPRKHSAASAQEGYVVHCIARLSGARFGVLLSAGEKLECDPVFLGRLSELADTMQQPFVVGLQEVYLSVNTGISTLHKGMQTVESLINAAESAMSYARQSCSLDYAFFTSKMMADTRRSLRMENAMRSALGNQEMSLVYQPKADVVSGSVCGAEALLRWNHAEFGAVSPIEFIPVAEDSGMIVSIGRWVLETACSQAMCWRRSINPDFQIAVNVSIRQLHDVGFMDMVTAVLQDSGLPAHALIIELTENMIMEDVQANMSKLARLREIGIRISIDDFGTGYSSLSYLQQFPVDQLKIDQSFIKQIKSIGTTAPIVKAIVSLAHDLNLSVVAEGVEEQLQLDYIRSLGCEEYQGYLKSRPLAVMDFEQVLLNEFRKCA